MEEQKRFPTLRFCEFIDGWDKVSFGDIASFKNGLNFGRKEKGHEIKVIGVGHFQDNFSIAYNKLDVIQVSENINDSFFLKNGDLLFVRSNGNKDLIGRTLFITDLKEKVSYSGFTIRARLSKNPNCHPLFIAHYFKTSIPRKEFVLLGGGTNISNLNQKILENLEINFPSIKEQQKIASCLSSVDKKIAQLQQKLALLEAYKKGTVQQIFSQELRFTQDDGSAYPDWVEKRLGGIGEFQTSSVDKLSKPDEKEVFLVNYMDVYNHKEINNETVKEYQLVTANDNQIKSCDLRKGDVLFTPSSETPDDIGHSVVIFEDIENAVFSYHVLRFRPTIELDILYSHYFCNNDDVLRQLSRMATGSTRFTISKGNFSNVVIKLPNIEEQTKIAHFLSAIDTKIAVVETQIENTQTFKKGLLQQMFV